MKKEKSTTGVGSAEEQNQQSRPSAVTGRLNTVGDVLADKVFQRKVADEIYELRKKRNERPDAKPGFRYRRDWYDQMTDAGTFNREYFLENIANIWAKKSSITSNTRRVIEYVCNNALRKTMEHYERIDSAAKSQAVQ